MNNLSHSSLKHCLNLFHFSVSQPFYFLPFIAHILLHFLPITLHFLHFLAVFSLCLQWRLSALLRKKNVIECQFFVKNRVAVKGKIARHSSYGSATLNGPATRQNCGSGGARGPLGPRSGTGRRQGRYGRRADVLCSAGSQQKIGAATGGHGVRREA